MKCKQPCPGFELESLILFPTMMPIKCSSFIMWKFEESTRSVLKCVAVICAWRIELASWTPILAKTLFTKASSLWLSNQSKRRKLNSTHYGSAYIYIYIYIYIYACMYAQSNSQSPCQSQKEAEEVLRGSWTWHDMGKKKIRVNIAVLHQCLSHLQSISDSFKK